MIKFIALLSFSIILNILGALLFIGSPGLQYVLLAPIVLISGLLTLPVFFIVGHSKQLMRYTFSILLITILLGLPLYLQNIVNSGFEMRTIGRICAGVGIPIQVILLYSMFRIQKRITNQTNTKQ